MKRKQKLLFFYSSSFRYFAWFYLKKVKVTVLVLQPCLCDPMAFSLPGSSLHGILQARILEWVVIPFSRGSSRPRDQTWVSWITGRFFTVWATREVLILASFESIIGWQDYFIKSVEFLVPPSWVSFPRNPGKLISFWRTTYYFLGQFLQSITFLHKHLLITLPALPTEIMSSMCGDYAWFRFW